MMIRRRAHSHYIMSAFFFVFLPKEEDKVPRRHTRPRRRCADLHQCQMSAPDPLHVPLMLLCISRQNHHIRFTVSSVVSTFFFLPGLLFLISLISNKTCTSMKRPSHGISERSTVLVLLVMRRQCPPDWTTVPPTVN